MRQQPFFEPDQEDVRELEALSRRAMSTIERRPARGLRLPSSIVMRAIVCVSSSRFLPSSSPFRDSQSSEVAYALPPRVRLLALVEVGEEIVLVANRRDQLVEEPSRRLALGAIAQIVDQRAERARAPRAGAPGSAPRSASSRRRGGEQARARAAVAELLERRRADAALRRRHRADERRIVVVVGDQPQVGDEVLDLGALEIRLSARRPRTGRSARAAAARTRFAWWLPR